jgi:hypothetical protein
MSRLKNVDQKYFLAHKVPNEGRGEIKSEETYNEIINQNHNLRLPFLHWEPIAMLVAQPGNSWYREGYQTKHGHPSPAEEARLNSAKQITNKPAGLVPDDLAAPRNHQRVAIAKCMKATDQVRSGASQMQAMARPWGRGRLGYSKNDLFALVDYREELRPVLTNFAAVHQEELGS